MRDFQGGTSFAITTGQCGMEGMDKI